MKIQTVRDDPASWVQYDFRKQPTFKVAVIPARGRTMAEPVIVAETEPEGPRVIGPEAQDGKAPTIRDVSVEFLGELPRSITAASAYRHSGNKEDFEINDSQVYSAIHFTLTNKTTEEIKVADIRDNFMVELVYDSGFTYSSNSEGYCFFQSGSQAAVVSKNSSVGKVTLAPLVTDDVTFYIACAKEVAENEDKILDVVFSSLYEDLETYRFAIR